MANTCGEVSIDSNPTAGAPTWPAAENTSPTVTKPSEQGGTVMWPLPPKPAAGANITGVTNPELVPSNSLQPPPASGTGAATVQPFQEVQMFIGEFARIMGISPRAAWMQIRMLGEMMFRRN